METVVRSDACKRIVFMLQRLVEGLTRLLQIFADRYIINADAQRQGVDKHTYRVGNLQVTTTTADRAEIDVAVVGVTRHNVCRGSKEQMSRCNLLLAAEGDGFVIVGKADSFSDESLSVGLGKVGRNFTCPFTTLQLFCKELLGRTEFFCLLSCLLVGHKVEISIGFLFNRLTFKNRTNLSDEQVGRPAVKDQMMKIYQKMYRLFGLYNSKPVKGNFLQVEWSDKISLVLSQLLFSHLCDRYCHRNAILCGLYDCVSFGGEMYIQFGMRLCSLLNSISQSLCISLSGEGEQVRDVVEG